LNPKATEVIILARLKKKTDGINNNFFKQIHTVFKSKFTHWIRGRQDVNHDNFVENEYDVDEQDVFVGV
jgi:hypothetical protein